MSATGVSRMAASCDIIVRSRRSATGPGAAGTQRSSDVKMARRPGYVPTNLTAIVSIT